MRDIDGRLLLLQNEKLKDSENSEECSEEILLENKPICDDNISFIIPKNFFEIKSISDLTTKQIDESIYNYIFLEVPAISKNQIPIELIQSFDLIIYFVNANRVWSEYDSSVIKKLKAITSAPTFSFLNGIRFDKLEGLIGELPKQRNSLRKTIKRFAKFQFKNW